MKVALVTDTHFGISNDSPVHAATIKNFFSKCFFPELKKRGISDIIHLGDVVDVRTKISYPTLQLLKNEYILPVVDGDYRVYQIIGNHDVYYRTSNDVSVADVFEPYSNFSVYNEVKDVQLKDGTKICMLPWINKNNESSVMEHLKSTDADYVMAHLEIKGALMMKGTVSEHGQEASVFGKFKKVFTGHYHIRSVRDNIVYIGNIAHFNWGDFGEERGFAIWDTVTGDIEYVNSPYSPYKKIYYDDVSNDYSDLSVYDRVDFSDKIIKIVTVNKENPYHFDLFMQYIESKQPYNVSVIENDILKYHVSDDGSEVLDIDRASIDISLTLSEYIKDFNLSEEQNNRVSNILVGLQKEALQQTS